MHIGAIQLIQFVYLSPVLGEPPWGRISPFSFISCLMSCGPFLIAGFIFMHIEVPAWLSVGRARALAGNYHSADFESLTFSDSFDGSLQFEAEAEVEDHIPAKSAALSVRPSAQRSAIAISNELFSWRCCPVFCDSEILLAPNERCLFEMLETSAKTFLGWSSRGGRERIVKGLRPGKHSKWALLLGRAGSPWGGDLGICG